VQKIEEKFAEKQRGIRLYLLSCNQEEDRTITTLDSKFVSFRQKLLPKKNYSPQTNK